MTIFEFIRDSMVKIDKNGSVNGYEYGDHSNNSTSGGHFFCSLYSGGYRDDDRLRRIL